MDTHHPHPDSYRDHKKKLTEYLLEFFMLFFAVFLGFIAENIRENIVEKEREKQYMISFLTDLSRDTSMLNAGFPKREAKIKAIDSIFFFFNSHRNVKSIPGAVFKTF